MIQSATFLKDADTFGKQDPYMQFKYEGKEYKTEVKDDAGKSAKWDDTFMMENILSLAKSNEQLVFEAYDKDIGSSDLLGFTDAIDIVDIVTNT